MSNNIGARDDSAATNTTDSWSVISILKGILSKTTGGSAAPVNRSSTITTGGTAQNAMAASSTRSSYFFQNISSEIMWGSWVGTAAPNAAGSFPISPNGVLRNTAPCETTALSIYGATTGKVFTAWEM